MLSKTILFVVLFASQLALAQGAIKFKSLKEARLSDVYRITCSDPMGAMQAHVYIEITSGRPSALKIVAIANSESLKVIEYTQSDLRRLKLVESKNELKISGQRPGIYLPEEFELSLNDSSGLFVGQLFYDDHDGMMLTRENISCGVVNYILSPSQ